VYSKYAERCGTERVIPLNPASFGKLVRVIFPGIQTRRLGVRGESKYHYVDLALLHDDEDGDEQRLGTAHSQQPGLQRQGSAGPKIDFKYATSIASKTPTRKLTRNPSSMPRLPADTAAFPAQDQAFESQSSFFSQGTSKGRLFTDVYSDGYRSNIARQTSNSYEYELKFATTEQMAPEENAAIVLPDISQYLPPRTDPDAAEALVALYRTHCTSLIDSVRYCKEKQFFRLFASFHGTLTVPVQKLFAQQEMAPWIRECDWMMYQKMIRNVSQLTLQVAPAQVLKFLDSVEKRLRDHLCKVFNSLPTHVLEARLEPATLFTHLLRQMLRVNSTAHAAAVMIMGDQNRDTMYDEFSKLVNLKRIIENELPQSCGHEEVYNIMKTEIRTLLLPLRIGGYMPDGTYYVEPAEDNAEYTNETVIDRIATFLTRLPSRFPQAPARTILHCVNALGSAILREITIENGQSFQGWWLTKVFVDELGHWLASLGGFLDHSPPDWMSYSPGLMADTLNTNMTNGGSGSNNESRYSSIDVDYAPNQSFEAKYNGHMQSNGNSNPESQSPTSSTFPPGLWSLTNARRTVHSRRNTQQFDQVSFNLDLDLATSQQEPGLEDSGIALLENDKISEVLRSHLSGLPVGVS
jgi:regulatory factor X